MLKLMFLLFLELQTFYLEIHVFETNVFLDINVLSKTS